MAAMIVRSSHALLTGGIDVHVHVTAADLDDVQLDPIDRRVVFDPIDNAADLLLALEVIARRLGDGVELEVESTPQLDRAAVVVDSPAIERARTFVADVAGAFGAFGRPPLEPADEQVVAGAFGRVELERIAGAELGFCCNDHCRRFEYRVAVTGDPELAVCTECTWRLVHESGLTWADAAAAGYRQPQQHDAGGADAAGETERKG